jgi:lipoate-protein ligase A
VIKVLNELGVPAEFQGRNDIVVDGKKISGNAQAWYKNKMLHHGTILFDANLAFVASVLNVKQDKFQSKGIKSNRARVENIKPLLQTNLDISEFKLILLKRLLDTVDITKANYPLSEVDLLKIKELQLEKYQQWNWNFGESPNSQLKKEKRFDNGNLQLHFNLQKGCIRDLKIYGDFLDTGNTDLITKIFDYAPYTENECRNRLSQFKSKLIFNTFSIDEFILCLFS